MKNSDYKGVAKFTGFVVGGAIALLLAVSILGFVVRGFWQYVEKARFGGYKYIVSNSDTYWYTNAYTQKGNCIYFANNYGNQSSYCEKYSVNENYFHTHGPTLTTMIWGVN